MPLLDPARTIARVRILVFAAGALALVLLWGCWLVYGAGLGTRICEGYSAGEVNPLLSQWCNGDSWRGWLGSCLAIAATLLAVAVGLALVKAQAAWLIPGTLLSAIAVLAGFAVPQEVATSNPVATQPNPSIGPAQPYQPPPATSTPPARSPLERGVPSPLPGARPRGLAYDIIPATLFACPRFGPVQTATGPGVITNFDAVVVERSSRGLCASFTSPAIATFAVHQEETEVVTLTFTAHRALRSSTRPTPRSFSIEVWAANQGVTYSLILRASDADAQNATVGNLGLARNHLSILIEQPRLPSWVLNPQSSWSAHLT